MLIISTIWCSFSANSDVIIAVSHDPWRSLVLLLDCRMKTTTLIASSLLWYTNWKSYLECAKMSDVIAASFFSLRTTNALILTFKSMQFCFQSPLLFNPVGMVLSAWSEYWIAFHLVKSADQGIKSKLPSDKTVASFLWGFDFFLSVCRSLDWVASNWSFGVSQ